MGLRMHFLKGRESFSGCKEWECFLEVLDAGYDGHEKSISSKISATTDLSSAKVKV